MSKRIRRGRAPTDLPVKDPPIAQDFLIATDYITRKLIRIPLSAIDTGGGGGEYSAGDGLNLSGSTFSVDTSVVRTDRQIIAGAGLSGGGNLGSNVTLSLDPDGVVLTSGNQSVSGVKTFTSQIAVQSSGIRSSSNNGSVTISGAASIVAGANIVLEGTLPAPARTGRLRTDTTTQLLWNQDGVEIAAPTTVLSGGNASIIKGATNSFMQLSGGSTRLLGGRITLFGQNASPANTGQLHASGTLCAQWNAAGFTFTAPSDRRIKEDVKPLAGLEAARQLNPVSFKFSRAYRRAHEGQIDDRERVGFIAQEYESVFPHAVEPSGEEFEGADVLQMTSQDALPIAIAAIKELDAEVQALKAELARLKGEPS